MGGSLLPAGGGCGPRPWGPQGSQPGSSFLLHSCELCTSTGEPARWGTAGRTGLIYLEAPLLWGCNVCYPGHRAMNSQLCAFKSFGDFSASTELPGRHPGSLKADLDVPARSYVQLSTGLPTAGYTQRFANPSDSRVPQGALKHSDFPAILFLSIPPTSAQTARKFCIFNKNPRWL